VHLDDGDRAAVERGAVDVDPRERQDVAIAANVRELAQELVGDRKACRSPSVGDADEHESTRAGPGEVVGVGADRLLDLGLVRQRLFALDLLTLEFAGELRNGRVVDHEAAP